MKKIFLYERLAKALLVELASGLYPTGRRFLSKRKITRRWNVSDPTARSALRRLAHQELIESHPRSGYYVRAGSQKRALLLVHRVRNPRLTARPGWESKRFVLRSLADTPLQPRKVTVILARLPGIPQRLPSLMSSSLLRAFECADAIWNAAARQHIDLEFFLDDGETERRRWITDRILALQPNGVIAFRRLISYVPLQPMLTPLVHAGLPVVTLFDDCEGLAVHSVNVNNVGMGYDAARRLLRFGHERMAVLLPDVSGDYFTDHAVGCEQAWRGAGRPAANLRVLRLPLQRSRLPALRKLLTSEPRPTAVYSSTATFMPELMNVLRRLRLAVPQDVSLIMSAGATRSPQMPRAVDTVQIDFPALGRRAFQILVDLLEGQVVNRSSFVEARYVSTGTVTHPRSIAAGIAGRRPRGRA